MSSQEITDSGDGLPVESASSEERAGIERQLGRQQRQFADRQRHLADLDASPGSAIRRRAAKFYDVAAVDHERAADEIEHQAAWGT